jgi:hypothetical protein
MNAMLPFMASDATPLDTAVADFVSRLPKGEGHVGCNYLWFAFEHDHPVIVSLEDFEASAARVTETSTVYGRRFIEGVDPMGVKSFYLGVFQ